MRRVVLKLRINPPENAAGAKMDLPRKQIIEAYKATERIKFYLAGGSRPVFVSRGILAGIVLVAWLVLWWQGFGK